MSCVVTGGSQEDQEDQLSLEREVAQRVPKALQQYDAQHTIYGNPNNNHQGSILT
jgi:hypothetical protein